MGANGYLNKNDKYFILFVIKTCTLVTSCINTYLLFFVTQYKSFFVEFLDSIYTERFMGLPTVDDNLKGYEDAQLLKKFEGMRDKQYFLIHGTHDDNVHYQQSMMWSRVLELNDILFRQQVSQYFSLFKIYRVVLM